MRLQAPYLLRRWKFTASSAPAFSNLIVELKAAEKLLPIHQAQLMSYLKATGCRLGLLVNFHERLLKDGVRRVVLTALDE
jgi:hypothetical protein